MCQRSALVHGRSKFQAPKEEDASVSPLPAPMAVKRRRFLDLNDYYDDEMDKVESEDEGEEMVKREEKRVLRKGAVRKLGDDFERVATNSGVVSKRNRSYSDAMGGDVMKHVEEVNIELEIEGDKKKRVPKCLKKGKEEVPSGPATRTSPRLGEHGSSSKLR